MSAAKPRHFTSPAQRRSAISDVAVLDLTGPALKAIDATLKDLLAGHGNTSESACIERISASSGRLPRELHTAIEKLAIGRHEPALLIRGFGVNDHMIGPTPPHWMDCRPFAADSPTRREEFLLTLVAQRIGELFGYASLQSGRLIHNVIPIAGAEQDQSGHGSRATLAWHTEDAFTSLRADYLALMGLRSRDAVATTLAGIAALEGLNAPDRRALLEARYAVVPDDEHLRGPNSMIPASASVLGDRGKATLIPVLSRTVRGLQMVIDPVYMEPMGRTAQGAFRRATQALDAALRRVPILPGAILIVDNHRAVHGRESFPARFDGTDRWLLKTSIAHSLEPSGPYRVAPGSRILQ